MTLRKAQIAKSKTAMLQAGSQTLTFKAKVLNASSDDGYCTVRLEQGGVRRVQCEPGSVRYGQDITVVKQFGQNRLSVVGSGNTTNVTTNSISTGTSSSGGDEGGGGGTPGESHESVTLAVGAEELLGLNGQELDLDVQVEGTGLFGPETGADAKPTFRRIKNTDLPNPLALPVTVQLTIASGIVTVTGNSHTIEAESGTTDDLVTISGAVANQFLMLRAKVGHTITIKHETGNLFLNGETDFVLTGNKALFLFPNGANLSDVGAGGGDYLPLAGGALTGPVTSSSTIQGTQIESTIPSSLGGTVIATGGDVSIDSDYTVHVFNESGVLSISAGGGAEILQIGGGGGASGGGGGAGRLLNYTTTLSVGNVTVTIGDGGAGTGAATTRGENGEDTTFGEIVALGGGGGGTNGAENNGGNGGSGGGGGCSGSLHSIGGTADADAEGDHGFGGGGNSDYRNAPYPAGGGGGAGGVGESAPSSTVSGNGGAGVNSDIIERGVFVGYAGGGGGGVWENYGTAGTASHGGGAGKLRGDSGDSGTPNTGGGGGGTGYDAVKTGGDGGSGIVVVRYLTVPTSSGPPLKVASIDKVDNLYVERAALADVATALAAQAAETIVANATSGSAAPTAVAIAEQRLVGRITGGHVTDLTAAEVKALLPLVNSDLPDPIALRAPTKLTISSGAVTVTGSNHTIAAESGTTDDLVTISGATADQILMLRADAGDTITVKHGTGNVFLNGAADFVLTGDKALFLFPNGANLSDVGAGGGGGGITVDNEGTPLATVATELDFVGAGVVASGTGAKKTITISGAAAVGLLPLDTISDFGDGDDFSGTTLDGGWSDLQTTAVTTNDRSVDGFLLLKNTGNTSAQERGIKRAFVPAGDFSCWTKINRAVVTANYQWSGIFIGSSDPSDAAGGKRLCLFLLYNSGYQIKFAKMNAGSEDVVVASGIPITFPMWIGIKRVGSTITAMLSYDGVQFEELSTTTTIAFTVETCGLFIAETSASSDLRSVFDYIATVG